MNADIERLAKEAGMHITDYGTCSTRGAGSCLNVETLAKFAALIAEECAKECETQADSHQDFKNLQAAIGCDICADAIRAKFPAPKGGE